MIEFELDNVEKAEEPLEEISYERVLERMILLGYSLDEDELSNFGKDFPFTDKYGNEEIFFDDEIPDSNTEKDDVENGRNQFPFGILAKDSSAINLVYEGVNPFFNGMHRAYAEHRPFVLSPDMIWLLISQGFAKHVNINSEKLRHHFVGYSGKMSVVIKTDHNIEGENCSWESVFEKFNLKIRDLVGEELLNVLSCDFSTSGSVERIASQITVMEGMKSYFEYFQFYAVCGFPKLLLEGNANDWEKVVEKLEKLSKYDLGWWVEDLRPILKEFISSIKGNVNKEFWRNMFKYHTPDEYGAPDIIDGWILKFFPYDKKGQRLGDSVSNHLWDKESTLPDEIVKVHVCHKNIDDGGETENAYLEFWAGFVGLEQDMETLALKPKIGWMVRKSDKSRTEEVLNTKQGDINLRLKEVPEEVLNLKKINELTLCFVDKVSVPEKLSFVKIGYLNVYGELALWSRLKILKLFPQTNVCINGVDYDKGKNALTRLIGGSMKYLKDKLYE